MPPSCLRCIRRHLRFNTATAATMGAIALPEMKKYKYGNSSRQRCAGGIGVLIPPSVVFIVYGMATEQSIGNCLSRESSPAFS